MTSTVIEAQSRFSAGLDRPDCRKIDAVRKIKDEGGERLTDQQLAGLRINREYEAHELSFWLQHPDTLQWERTTVRPDFYLPEFDLFLECTRKRCIGGRRRRIQALMRGGKYIALLDDIRLEEMKRNPRWLKAFIEAVRAQIRLLEETSDLVARQAVESALAQLLAPFTPPAPRKRALPSVAA